MNVVKMYTEVYFYSLFSIPRLYTTVHGISINMVSPRPVFVRKTPYLLICILGISSFFTRTQAIFFASKIKFCKLYLITVPRYFHHFATVGTNRAKPLVYNGIQ